MGLQDHCKRITKRWKRRYKDIHCAHPWLKNWLKNSEKQKKPPRRFQAEGLMSGY